MKKILLMMLFIVCGYTAAMAGSDLKVVSGNAKFMKTAEGNAVLTFDWEGAKYDNREPLETKFTDLEHLKTVAWEGFSETFNEKSKNVKIVSDSERANAKYKFSMKVKNMDQYFKVMGFIPSNATKVWGTLTVIDLSTNTVIAVVEVNEVDGGANPSYDGTFSDCFEELAKQVTKLK